jgi:hypothetical protein
MVCALCRVLALVAGGNWIAAAQDMRGRVYIIDQAGDLYYDSGNPDIGIYAVSDTGRAAAVLEASERG